MKSAGDRIKHARTTARIGSRELDRLAGLVPNHTAIIERRRSGITAEVAVKIAIVLGTTVEYLCAGIGDPPSAEQTASAVQAAKEKLKDRESTYERGAA